MSQKSLQNSGKYSTTVEFHVFEIHTLNADMRLLKSIPFFPRFHEIDILNGGLRRCIKSTLSRVFLLVDDLSGPPG